VLVDQAAVAPTAARTSFVAVLKGANRFDRTTVLLISSEITGRRIRDPRQIAVAFKIRALATAIRGLNRVWTTPPPPVG
jgi:hypothetical protein